MFLTCISSLNLTALSSLFKKNKLIIDLKKKNHITLKDSQALSNQSAAPQHQEGVEVFEWVQIAGPRSGSGGVLAL